MRRKLIACDPFSSDRNWGDIMASFITGSRPRRAVALQFVCACVFAGLAQVALAQQSDDPTTFHGSAPVASGDGWCEAPCGPDCGTCCCGDPCDSCEPSCGCASPCGPQNRKYCYGGWVGAEWLHWQLNGNRLPPLVTDGPATTDQADVAQLDDPDTRILSGDDTVNDGWRNGYRLFGGVWLNCCHTWGVGGDYFNIGNDDYNFLGRPETDRIVGRPFFNTETGEDDAELVSVPNELDGTVHVNSGDDFQGAGVTLTHCLWRCCDSCSGNESQIAALGGYRFYKYDSDLTITENLTVLEDTTTPLVPGTTFFVQDSFRTRNEFHGGEIGLQGYKQHCWWWVDGMAKVAIGENSRTVIVNGRTVTTVPDDTTTDVPGGLLTSSETNIGSYHDTDFAVIPEFRLGVGALLTRCWSIHAGYDVIIWSDVARAASHLPPGLQVDPRNIPPVQTGGGDEPVFPGIRGSQLVAHGFDLSVSWQF